MENNKKRIFKFVFDILVCIFLVISFSLMIAIGIRGIVSGFNFETKQVGEKFEIVSINKITSNSLNYNLIKAFASFGVILSLTFFILKIVKYIINQKHQKNLDLPDKNKLNLDIDLFNKIVNITFIVLSIILIAITVGLSMNFPNESITEENTYQVFSLNKENYFLKAISFAMIGFLIIIYYVELNNEAKLLENLDEKTKIILSIILRTFGILFSFGYLIVALSLMIKPTNYGVYNFNNELQNMDIIKNINYTILKTSVVLGLFLICLLTVLIIIKFILNEIKSSHITERLKKFNLSVNVITYIILPLLLTLNLAIAIIYPGGTSPNWDNIDSFNNYSKTLAILSVIVIIALFTYNIYKDISKKDNTTFTIKDITEGAIMVALAVVFDIVIDLIGLKMPQGGAFSFALLPIFIYTLRKGPLHGFVAGLLFGILNFLQDGYFLHWGSIFLDYLIAFSLLGFVAGLFSKKSRKGNFFITILAVFLGGLVRYLSSSFSGVLFFSEYVPQNMNPWYYSFIFYNMPYNAVSTGICIIFISLLYKPLINENTKVV